jgi:hypothetical protein
MLRYLIPAAIILVLLLGWILVQHLARRYAARHPEFGPAREEGLGCDGDGGCGCQARHCEREKHDHG